MRLLFAFCVALVATGCGVSKSEWETRQKKTEDNINKLVDKVGERATKDEVAVIAKRLKIVEDDLSDTRSTVSNLGMDAVGFRKGLTAVNTALGEKDGKFAYADKMKILDELAGKVTTFEDRLPPVQADPMGGEQQQPSSIPAVPEQVPQFTGAGVMSPQYTGPPPQQAQYIVEQSPPGATWKPVYCRHKKCRYLWRWEPGYIGSAVLYKPCRRRARCGWHYEWVWEPMSAPPGPGFPVPWQ